MYSKKTLSLLALIAGAALIVAYWPQIKGFVSGKLGSLTGGNNLTPSGDKGSSSSSSGGSGSSATPVATANTSGTVSFSEVLKKGSKGASVIMLQQLLNAGWQKGLVVDGKFGPKTEGALYQVTNKYNTTLTAFVNGYVNPNSQAYTLFKALTSK